MLEWTGERYLPYIDPSISGAEIHYEHLHRYAFASQYVKGKKVLDLASGEGYGTFILSKNADYVIGIEIDGSAVTHASQTYKKENIEFREGSILKIPIEGEKKFDVIVCFEALEHVKEHDTLFFEIKRLLKDDGILIISTPNKQTYTDDTGYHNPFHQKELYYAEFSDFLKKYFSYIYLFGQRIFSGSSISPTSVKAPNSCSEFFIEQEKNHFTFTRDDEKIYKYFIAIASDAELNLKKFQKSYLIDKSNTEIALLYSHVNQSNGLIQSLEQEVAGKDRQLLDVTAYNHSLEQAIIDKDQQLRDIAAHNQSLEQAIIDKDQQLRDIAAYNQSLEQAIINKDQQHGDIAAYNQSLEQAIINKEHHIKILEEYVLSLKDLITAKDEDHRKVDEYARSFEQVIIDKDQHIINLDNYILSLKDTISEKEHQHKQVKEHARLEMIAKKNQIRRLNYRIRSLEKQLSYFIKQ